MTYRTPELHLIGAAANLVLESSNVPKTEDPQDCSSTDDELLPPTDEWSIPGNW